MLGYINANNLKKYDEAKKFYQAFIKQYPKSDLVDDAKFELKIMGKDINSLSIFQGKAAQDSLKK